VYVSSGLSNPWEGEKDPGEFSGYGCEFAIETAYQADWAIGLLHHLASIQLLTMSGRIAGEPFDRGHRVALHGPIDCKASTLRHVLITAPSSFGPVLEQRSGVADWLFCVGISDAEKAFAREHDNEQLLDRLTTAVYVPITDPGRASLVI
jgi:hypothetical protein